MPPRPLSSVLTLPGNPTIHLHAINQEPGLASMVANFVSGWSFIEAELGRLLVCLLGAEARPGLAMYAALRSSSAQNAALNAAARAVLTGTKLEAFEAVMRLVSRERKVRNAMAHNVWAVHPACPDCLVLVEADALLDFEIHKATSSPQSGKLEDLTVDPGRALVYSSGDLFEASPRMETVRRYVHAIIEVASPDKLRSDQVCSYLCGLPEVRSAIEDVRCNRRGRSEVPLPSPS